MREHTYPASYEAHLRRRVKELEGENEKLLGACEKLLAVHTTDRGDYVEAVMTIADVVTEITHKRYSPTT